MEQSKERPTPAQTFVDETQRVWEVREIRAAILPNRTQLLARPGYSAGWLLFSSGAERRRLAPLPPGWREAPAAQLCRWCEDASPARPRTES
jgi:hypothetical protein